MNSHAEGVENAAAERTGQERPLLQSGSDPGCIYAGASESSPAQPASGPPAALCGGPGPESHSSLLDINARDVRPESERVGARLGPVPPSVCSSSLG